MFTADPKDHTVENRTAKVCANFQNSSVLRCTYTFSDGSKYTEDTVLLESSFRNMEVQDEEEKSTGTTRKKRVTAEEYLQRLFNWLEVVESYDKDIDCADSNFVW